MYLDRAVLIPKVKGISFRTKGENTYVQYEIGRVYNPEKKYNNPRRVDIGIRIPEQEEMMLPNENYLQYFSDEMEKAEGVRENLLGDYEEERQGRSFPLQLTLKRKGPSLRFYAETQRTVPPFHAFPLKNFPPQAEMRDLKGMKGILGFPLKGIFPLKKEADTKEGFPVKRTGTVLSFQLSLQLQGPSPPFHLPLQG